MKAELRPAGTGGPRRCGDGGAGVSMKVSLKVWEGGQVVVFVSGKNGKETRRLGNSLRKCGVQGWSTLRTLQDAPQGSEHRTAPKQAALSPIRNQMKREAGGQGEFSVGRIFGAATSPIFGRQDFWVNFRI